MLRRKLPAKDGDFFMNSRRAFEKFSEFSPGTFDSVMVDLVFMAL